MQQDQFGMDVTLERAIESLATASSRLSEAEARVNRARQDLQGASNAVLDQLRKLREETGNEHDPHVIKIVRHLYWQQQSIQSRDIAEAAGFGVGNRGIHGMLAAIGPVMSGILCTGCRAELLRTSRSWGPGTPPLCPQCVSEKDAERNRQSRVHFLQAQAVGSALVPAPARDWRVVTAVILAYPPAANGVLRGSEEDRQLGIWRQWEMAQTLHDAIHQLNVGDDQPFGVPAAVTRILIATGFQGAGWDSTRTRELIDPITDEAAHSILTRIKKNLDATVQTAARSAQQTYVHGSETRPDAPWPWERDHLYWWHPLTTE